MILHELLLSELTFKTSRSGGPGGQHVNKVESRVTALWDVNQSHIIDVAEKELIKMRLSNRINAAGILAVDASESRSQLENKELAIEKLLVLLNNALKPVKKRIPRKISKAQVLARLDRKKRQADKKDNRRWRLD